MINPMFLADRLSGLNLRLRLRLNKSARLRRRPSNRRLQVAAEILRLEDRCLLASHALATHAHIARPKIGDVAVAGSPTVVQDPPPFPEMPTGNARDASAVMYQTDKMKTVTITNDSPNTIYPILEGENSKGALYDTHDTPPNQEYRVYVGYSDGGTNYFGLQTDQSITVPIPQAIWDSGRLNIVADTPETAQTFESPTLPFLFSPNAAEPAATYVQPISGTNGVLFLYHDKTPNVIGPDAPAQLVEWSVRDKSVTPDAGTSVDYDLSYLDHMYLPVAVEAVPGTGKPKVGYIGTTLQQSQFQKTLQMFTDGSLLNGYFGGQGWPQYNLGTSNPTDPLKIPGGYNVFELSPSTSNYNINVPMLTSSQQTSVTPSNNDNYAVQAITDVFYSWADFYRQMWADPAKYDPPGQHIEATPALKEFMSTDPDSIRAQDNVQTFNIQYTPSGKYDLKHAEAFATNVWKAMWTFSDDTASVSTTKRFITSTGTIGAVGDGQFPADQVLSGVSPSVLAEIEAQPGGAKSTPVVGPDIPQRDNIYQIDGNNIILLTPATGTLPATNTYRFYFYPPNPKTQPEIQSTSQLIAGILGDSIGELETLGGKNWNGDPWSDTKTRQAFTENVIKPLMYGVTTPADEKDANIPAPGDPKTDIAAQYNVDPLVWFVHTAANWPDNERIFAYAFSVDDDYGNVQIYDSSDMEVTVGGAAGLTDPSPYVKPK